MQRHRRTSRHIAYRDSMSTLLRLICVSRAVSAPDSVSTDALLGQARERKEELNVTGGLCTGRRHFVQLIEGPQINVMDLYSRICRDERHHGVQLVSQHDETWAIAGFLGK